MAGSELLLINPRARRKGRKSSKHRARRRNPVRALSRTAKRRSKNKRRHVAGYYPNPRRAYRRRRRNPLSLSGMRSGMGDKVMGAVLGAGGAIVNDALMSYIPLPVMLKSGPMAILSKAAGAFAVGYLASFAVGKSRGSQMAEGALTVLAYQVAKPMVQSVLPGLAGNDIEGLGFYSPGMILQDSLSPLPDLNAGTPLAAYLSGMERADASEGGSYDSTIDSYIS